MHWRRKWQPTPVFLPGESQGRGSLPSMGSHRVGHDWRDLAAAEGYGNQYWAIHSSILAWRTPLPDRETWQATVYRVAKSWTRLKWPCIHRHKTFFFLPVAALPQWELNMKVAQLLGLQGPWQCQVYRDTDPLCCRSYGPIRVFFQASFSWWSEGFFDQSFSVTPPVEALRVFPCLESFSVVQRVRHIEGSPWPESYSVSWHARHLKGHPGWVPTL